MLLSGVPCVVFEQVPEKNVNNAVNLDPSQGVVFRLDTNLLRTATGNSLENSETTEIKRAEEKT